MKEHVTFEELTISVSAGLLDQLLDPAVDPLCRGISQAVRKKVTMLSQFYHQTAYTPAGATLPPAQIRHPLALPRIVHDLYRPCERSV